MAPSDGTQQKGDRMQEYEVTCVNKPNRQSPHEHITHIGNTGGNWRITRERAIALIEAKEAAFFTVDGMTGKKAYVGVVRTGGNRPPYLRTHADGKWRDNLLALAECTSACRIV
jgi:hypothetical protein